MSSEDECLDNNEEKKNNEEAHLGLLVYPSTLGNRKCCMTLSRLFVWLL